MLIVFCVERPREEDALLLQLHIVLEMMALTWRLTLPPSLNHPSPNHPSVFGIFTRTNNEGWGLASLVK